MGQVEETVARYLGQDRTREAFAQMAGTRDLADDPNIEADVAILNFGEHLLASAVGPASSRLVMALLLERHSKGSRDAIQLLDDASSAIEHSRTVLQTAIDNVPQGMAVFDKTGELVSWNAAFRDVLMLPQQMLRVGTTLDDVIAFVAARNGDATGNLGQAIAQRRSKLLQPPVTFRERLNHPPRVLDVHSGALPDGGIVVTFADVTDTVNVADALLEANETLEHRVVERTAELTKLNGELAKAKAAAEAANQGKTRFIAAASHDILQPLNAARLFTSTLVEQQGNSANGAIVRNVDAALEAVEDILSTVLDISRLDAGAIKPEISSFDVQDLFDALSREYAPAAAEKGVELTFVASSVVLRSDRKLLRRILQNLVSNAIKYTPSGRIVVGVRRGAGKASICVADTGLGIPQSQLKAVFREFERLGREGSNEPGLGFGTVDRRAHVQGVAPSSQCCLGS